VLGAVSVAVVVPVQVHAQPPTQCLTNTPKGKQVYVPCDLLNAGANFPPRLNAEISRATDGRRKRTGKHNEGLPSW
jgi:hypothetical protein